VNRFYAHLPQWEQFEVLKDFYLDGLEFHYDTQNLIGFDDMLDEYIFYHIPNCSKYRITSTGVVANVHEGFIVDQTNNKTGYPAVTIRRDGDCRSVTAHVHRLLALVFIEPPNDDFISLQVNHSDGVKTNFSLSNLEWCTQQQNCQHAYKTGLRKDVTPIEIINTITGEIEVVYSMGEAGRFFNVSAAAIHWQLNYRKVKTPYKGYNIRYADGRITPKYNGVYSHKQRSR